MMSNTCFSLPDVLDIADVRPAMRVADFGAGGNGHIVIPLSRMVGEEGIAYAVDIHPEALSMLRGHRSLHCIPQLQIVRGDFERFGGVDEIPAQSLDRIFVVNTLWMTRHFAAVVAEIRRLLAPDGVIIIVDWEHTSRHPIAPDPLLRIHPHVVDRVFAEGGCRRCTSFQPDAHHFGRIYSH